MDLLVVGTVGNRGMEWIDGLVRCAWPDLENKEEGGCGWLDVEFEEDFGESGGSGQGMEDGTTS